MGRLAVTQGSFYDTLTKRVHFLPLGFLPGRLLKSDLAGQDRVEEPGDAPSESGFGLDELEEDRCDAAWGACEETFACTNRTASQEALEAWPVRLTILTSRVLTPTACTCRGIFTPGCVA